LCFNRCQELRQGLKKPWTILAKTPPFLSKMNDLLFVKMMAENETWDNTVFCTCAAVNPVEKVASLQGTLLDIGIFPWVAIPFLVCEQRTIFKISLVSDTCRFGHFPPAISRGFCLAIQLVVGGLVTKVAQPFHRTYNHIHALRCKLSKQHILH